MGFIGLNTAYSGLVASQIGIDTSSHNVSNSSTPGYTRQRVDQFSRQPLLRSEGFIGQGVEVTDVRRARDEFLDARVRSGFVSLGSMLANSSLLGRAEAVLGEPEEGLTTALTDVFDAFEDLATTPDDRAARVTVIETLEQFAGRSRNLAGALDRLAEDTAENLSYLVDEVNQLLGEVGQVNQAILEAVTSGQTPNDLLDIRDRLLDEVTRKAGVNVIGQGEWGVRVSLNGMALVDGVNVSSLTLDNTTYEVSHPTGVTLSPGGELGGTQQFLQGGLVDLRNDLNTFVGNMVTSLNTQHAAGFSDTGVSGTDLFTVTPGAELMSIAVATTDPDAIAASSADGTPFPALNGINAQTIADLRDGALPSELNTIVTELGARVATSRRAAEAQDELVAAAEQTRDGAHGVSLDEEMVLLVQYQRSYQAAARVLTTVDATLDTLINRTGLVGR